MMACEKCGNKLNENGECENCILNEGVENEPEMTVIHEQSEEVQHNEPQKPRSYLAQIKENFQMMIETPKALTILSIVTIISIIACFFFGAQRQIFSSSTTVVNSSVLFLVFWIIIAVFAAVLLTLSIICNINRKKSEKIRKK